MVWAAIRYRRSQAVLIALLSALITACAVFAPLYERSLEQALVRTALADAPVDASGVSLTSRSSVDQGQVASVEDLARRVPHRLRASSLPPVGSVRVTVSTGATPRSPAGTLLSRDAVCAHLDFPRGRCPERRNEIAVSTADAALWKWSPGQRIRLLEVVSTVDTANTPHKLMTITGIYRQRPGSYWFNIPVVGSSGTVDPQSGQVSLDTIVTSAATMAGEPATSSTATDPSRSWVARVTELDVPLRTSSVGIAAIGPLAAEVDTMTTSAAFWPQRVTVRSALPDIAAGVNRGRDQAALIVPLLMAQLVLLAVVVLRLVLAAAIEQRRPEVALARMRGRGAAGARRLLIAELGATVLAGVPLGVVVAFALDEVARRAWLVPGVPFELPASAFVAALLAALVSLLTTLLATRPAAREQVSALLRRVPERRGGWTLGVADAVAVAIALAGLVAVASGNLSGPLALATPMLLALAVGLVASHVLVPASAVVGRRLLGRGRVAGGLTALVVSRRPAVRRAVAIVTVAAALVVFAGDALLVGARNRQDRAELENGAPVSVEVSPANVVATRKALARVDPAGTDMTPVLRVRRGGQGIVTQAVLPDQFRRLAYFPGRDPDSFDWAALAAPAPAPLHLVGRQLRVTIEGLDVHRVSGQSADAGVAGAHDAPEVGLGLVAADGSRTTVIIGGVPYGRSAPRTLTAPIRCAGGCTVTGLLLVGPTQTVTAGHFRLSDLRADAGPTLPLSRPGEWAGLAGSSAGDVMTVSGAAGGPGAVTLGYTNGSTLQMLLRHGADPARLPALVEGPLPADATGDTFSGAGLDGVSRDMSRSSEVPFVPGGSANVALVNLDVLQREGGVPSELSTMQVWLRQDDPALVRRLTQALHAQGLGVASTTRVVDIERGYERTAPAWGLRLALVVGLAALVMAALVVVVVVATSWRQRARDYAALQMAGVHQGTLRRIAVGEQLVVVVVATLLGSACGLAGAQLSLPIVPLFSTEPAVSLVDLTPAWTGVGLAAGTALLALAAVAVVVGRGLADRSTPDLVRESM